MSNQRSSFRISTAVGQRAAKLRHGSRDYRAVLENESAGGFAVLVDCALNVETGETLSLFTSSGGSVVRVVNSTSQEGHTRLGLERVEDLPNLADLKDVKGSWRSYVPGLDCRGIGWLLYCALLLIAAARIGWPGLFDGSKPDPWSHRVAVQDVRASLQRRFSKAFQDRWDAAEKAHTRIELSKSQQRRISEILRHADQEILELRSKGQSSDTVESERMQVAEAEILSVLDEQQRSMWDHLAEAQPDSAQP